MHVYMHDLDLNNCIFPVMFYLKYIYSPLPRHPTSCCSAAELMSVLFFNTMRYKAEDPRNQCNDRFVLSKVGYFFFLWETDILNLVRTNYLWYCYCLQRLSSPFLGPCCTHPVRCLGRGRLREGVWSAQPAQDRLWPGGPPHPSKSQSCYFMVFMFNWETEYSLEVNFIYKV